MDVHKAWDFRPIQGNKLQLDKISANLPIGQFLKVSLELKERPKALRKGNFAVRELINLSQETLSIQKT